MLLPTLNATQQALLNEVLLAYNAPYSNTSVDNFQKVYEKNILDNEVDFDYDEAEQISMFYGWA